MRARPEIEPFSTYVEVYVETADVDRLHEEWRTCGLLAASSGIAPALQDGLGCTPAVRDHERGIEQAISTLETGLRRTPSDPEIADQLGT